MTRRCGWCGKWMWPTKEKGAGVTHGMCQWCKAQFKYDLAEYKRRRAMQKNPGGHIPGQAVEIRYRRGASGYYKHAFRPGVRQRRLRPGQTISTPHNAVMLYHPSHHIWDDDRTPGFWTRHGHGGSNSMARTRRGGLFARIDITTVALLAGVGYLIYSTWMAPPAEAVVSTGGQGILAQPAGTVWYSDPFQQSPDGMSGDMAFFIGSLPPGSAPPWRLASVTEIDAMNLGLMAGTIVAAGGGLIVHV